MHPEKKKELSEDIDSLTVHGVSRIKSAKTKLGKIIWTILCISAVSTLLKFIIDVAYKHSNKEVYIKTQRKQLDKMFMPAITFCNTNFWDFHVYPVPVFQELPKTCYSLQDSSFKNDKNKEFFKFGCKLFLANFPQQTAQLENNDPENVQFPKSFSFLPSFWPCFTLNRNSTLQQHLIAERQGLHMILYFDGNEFKGKKQSYFSLNDERKGLYVNVHDPKIHIYKYGGIYLTPGFHTHIKIRKVINKRKPSPYPSKCVKDGEEKYEKIVPGKHTLLNCYFACEQLSLYRACNGIYWYMRPFMSVEKYPKTARYHDEEYEKCAATFTRGFSYENCNCQVPCYEEIYETEVDRNPWPQSWQKDAFTQMVNAGRQSLNRNVTYEEIRQKLVKLSIYYDDFAEEIREEKEMYTLSSIVSDIGGQMGLFLGASWLSIIEVCILIWNFILGWFAKETISNQSSP